VWLFRKDQTDSIVVAVTRWGLLALVLLTVLPGAGSAETTVRLGAFRPIASGFDSPTYVTAAPGEPGTLYVVEQPGRIRTVRNGRITGTFLDIRDRVLAEGERGLLSMAFHPRYAQNRLFYIDYTDLAGDTHVLELSAHTPSSERELLFVDQPYPNHNGGQLAFDPAGRLYVGMGDGGTPPDDGGASLGDPQNRAQNLDSRLGKLLRIDPLREDAQWQIVGLGLRNPWRFSFDRRNGNLWLGDVGAATSEEIDRRPAALIGTLANYGWSRWEGRFVYNRRIALRAGRLVQPVYVYSHGASSCGVIGGYVYRGARLPAARGRYFFGDLCTGVTWALKLGTGGLPTGVKDFTGRVPNLSSFGEDGRGELYAVGLDGVLYGLR